MKIVPGGGLPFYGVPYVAVVNAEGVPVWWFREPGGNPMDAKFAGPRSIFWQARGTDGGLVHDLRGRVTRKVNAVDAMTDQHDVQFTPDGGYLVIGARLRDCPRVPSECVDLSRWGGPTQATVLDNEVQKLDRRGRLKWRWSTRNNIAAEEVASWIGSPLALPLVNTDGRRAYDLFHINSVDEDGDGVLVSIRHLDAIVRISKKARKVDWKLGGTPTSRSLEVTGAGSGGNLFGGQHEARFLPDGTISVMDNGSLHWRPPRVLRFRVSGRRAKVIENVSDARTAFSVGIGGATKLPGGNWAVAWGAGSSLISELTSGGRPVFSMTLPDGLLSYRVSTVQAGRVKAADLRAGMDAQYPR
jgi:hypothetical protein